MTVKTIFKSLLGTILVIVVASLIIEMFNTQTTSLGINQVAKIACRQACELFAKETYKKDAIDISNVYSSSGSMYISSEFYNGNTAEEIYKNIYTSNEFKSWINSSTVKKGDWKNINILDAAINGTNKNKYDKNIIKTYTDNMITPLNMGIPYLDKQVINKIFKWNLAEILSNCNSGLIDTDLNGKMYVRYKGFRIYASEASITNIEYKTYDLRNESDAAEFKSITNMDASELIHDSKDEQSRVCIAGIKYSIPISYEGITPLKRIVSYATTKDVEAEVDPVKGNLNSGGIKGNKPANGVLPVPGKLIYYLIR